MKTFVFAIFILIQSFSGQTYGQECLDDVFEIEIKNINSDEIEIYYNDKNRSKFKYSPKFDSAEPMDNLISIKANTSIQKKDSIEQMLFKTEELDTLKRGIAIYQLHIPSGKIVSVSFILQNKVDINKLKRLKNEIEKNLYYEVKLYAELEKEGYWTLSYPIFVSHRKQ